MKPSPAPWSRHCWRCADSGSSTAAAVSTVQDDALVGPAAAVPAGFNVAGMARDEQRQRVRERLGGLDLGGVDAAASEPAEPQQRWDLEELEAEPSPLFQRAPATSEDWEVAGPDTPQWLSEPVGSVSVWQRQTVGERFRGLRLDPRRPGVVVLGVVGVAAVVVAAAAAYRDTAVVRPAPPLSAAAIGVATTTEPPASSPGRADKEPRRDPPAPPSRVVPELVVSVVGLVEHPGLLHLPAGARVADAVSVAVAKDGADVASLNLAQRLLDGDQVVVGAVPPGAGPPKTTSTVVPGTRDSPRSASTTPSGPRTPVDLNTATETELDALPGVGQATAQAILAWRAEHGRFTSVDQLAEVAGIGPARLERLRRLVTV